MWYFRFFISCNYALYLFQTLQRILIICLNIQQNPELFTEIKKNVEQLKNNDRIKNILD